MDKPYSVDLWGSHPNAGNDDCWTGASFDTLDEALSCYRALSGSVGNLALARKLEKACGHDWEFVCIDGPDIHDVSANPDQPSQKKRRKQRERDDADWRREQATQAGMVFGCDGYNDTMGY